MAASEIMSPWREGQDVECEVPDLEGGTITRTATVQIVTGEGQPDDVVILGGVYGDNVYRVADDSGLVDRFGNHAGWKRVDGGDD